MVEVRWVARISSFWNRTDQIEPNQIGFSDIARVTMSLFMQQVANFHINLDESSIMLAPDLQFSENHDPPGVLNVFRKAQQERPSSFQAVLL